MLNKKLKILIFIFLASIGAAAELFAQDVYVKEVRFEGVTRVSEQTLRPMLRTRPGAAVGREEINQDIHDLFGLGFFKDVQVHREGGVYTFVFVEKQVITKIVIEGNKKIKDAPLREAITIPLYQPLREAKVAESVEAIRKLYIDKKYYLAEISHRLRVSEKGDTEFVFSIREHSPALIRQVQFIGNTVFGDEELRKVVRTRRKSGFGWLTGAGKFDEEYLKEDVLRLTFHYLKNGYLKVQVEQPRVTLTKDKKYFFVTFRMTEGDRYRISSVNLEGDILTTQAELMLKLLTKKEQIYNREFIERDLQMLTQLYANQGYAFVHIRPLTETDEIQKTAAITYHIVRGERIAIERIEIHGNTITRDKVIRRELKLKEGDIYNESKLNESKDRVKALGFFKDVNFATPRGSKDNALNLDVTVEEKPTGSFSIGAGFSTVDNFILQGSLQKQNFFGRGWNGEISAELSSRYQQFLFSMTDPYFLDSEWMLGLSSQRTNFRYEDFDRESYGGSFSVGHRLFDYSSINLTYQAEQVSAVDFASFVPQRFKDNASGLTSLISLALIRDNRDNRIYAKKGTYHLVKAEVSGSKLGGDNDFFRITGKSQYYQPLGKKFIFKTFARAGYIENLGNRTLPLFNRFFLGGVNSLRGYYPESIGPTENVVDSTGKARTFVFGGDKMVAFNGEVEYVLFEPAGLNAVVFFDAGNAFGEGETLAFDRLRLDYGFGLRWVSPMGPLRFEWGFPINRKSDERKTVFNFTIGTFF